MRGRDRFETRLKERDFYVTTYHMTSSLEVFQDLRKEGGAGGLM